MKRQKVVITVEDLPPKKKGQTPIKILFKYDPPIKNKPVSSAAVSFSLAVLSLVGDIRKTKIPKKGRLQITEKRAPRT